MKFVMCDMDGTLLNDKKELPTDFKEVYNALKNKGVDFGIASGRQMIFIEPFFKDNFEDMYVIANNGTTINRGHELLDCAKFDKDIIRAVEEETLKHDNLFVIYMGIKEAYYNYDDEETMDKIRFYIGDLNRYHDIEDVLTKDEIIKVAIYDVDYNAEENAKYYEEFNKNASVLVSDVQFFDIVPKGSSKGKALEKIMEEKGYSAEDVVVFGDYNNDISMLEKVKYSYAMGNAVKEVKEVANYSCPDNNHNGVTCALKELFKL